MRKLGLAIVGIAVFIIAAAGSAVFGDKYLHNNQSGDALAIAKTSHTVKNTQMEKKSDTQSNDNENETALDGITADEAWKQAYMGYLKKHHDTDSDYESYELINVNGDGIPELVANGVCEASGNLVLNYSKGEVHETQLDRLGYSYIEGENLMINSDGHMGYYYDIIYQIQNGRLTQIAKGKYGLLDGREPDDTKDYESQFTYEWQGKSVTKDQYDKNLEEVFDWSKSNSYQDTYSYDEIIQKIKDYSAEYNSQLITLEEAKSLILQAENSISTEVTDEVLGFYKYGPLHLLKGESDYSKVRKQIRQYYMESIVDYVLNMHQLYAVEERLGYPSETPEDRYLVDESGTFRVVETGNHQVKIKVPVKHAGLDESLAEEAFAYYTLKRDGNRIKITDISQKFNNKTMDNCSYDEVAAVTRLDEFKQLQGDWKPKDHKFNASIELNLIEKQSDYSFPTFSFKYDGMKIDGTLKYGYDDYTYEGKKGKQTIYLRLFKDKDGLIISIQVDDKEAQDITMVRD